MTYITSPEFCALPLIEQARVIPAESIPVAVAAIAFGRTPLKAKSLDDLIGKTPGHILESRYQHYSQVLFERARALTQDIFIHLNRNYHSDMGVDGPFTFQDEFSKRAFILDPSWIAQEHLKKVVAHLSPETQQRVLGFAGCIGTEGCEADTSFLDLYGSPVDITVARARLPNLSLDNPSALLLPTPIAYSVRRKQSVYEKAARKIAKAIYYGDDIDTVRIRDHLAMNFIIGTDPFLEQAVVGEYLQHLVRARSSLGIAKIERNKSRFGLRYADDRLHASILIDSKRQGVGEPRFDYIEIQGVSFGRWLTEHFDPQHDHSFFKVRRRLCFQDRDSGEIVYYPNEDAIRIARFAEGFSLHK